jgi:hypothetical protein
MHLDSGTREYLAEIVEESVLELVNISAKTLPDQALQALIQTELHRLDETAEFCGFTALCRTLLWVEHNLQALSEQQLLQQKNEVGDFYLWLELLAVALNSSDTELHAELKFVLQQEDWLLPIEASVLQDLLDTLPQASTADDAAIPSIAAIR